MPQYENLLYFWNHFGNTSYKLLADVGHVYMSMKETGNLREASALQDEVYTHMKIFLLSVVK